MLIESLQTHYTRKRYLLSSSILCNRRWGLFNEVRNGAQHNSLTWAKSAELEVQPLLPYTTCLPLWATFQHCTQSVRSSAPLISIISFNALGRYWYLFLTCWLKIETLECVHSNPWPTKPSPWLPTLCLARKEQTASQTFRMSFWMSLSYSLPVSKE